MECSPKTLSEGLDSLAAWPSFNFHWSSNGKAPSTFPRDLTTLLNFSAADGTPPLRDLNFDQPIRSLIQCMTVTWDSLPFLIQGESLLFKNCAWNTASLPSWRKGLRACGMDVLKVVQQLRDLTADPQNRATIVRVKEIKCVFIYGLANTLYYKAQPAV